MKPLKLTSAIIYTLFSISLIACGGGSGSGNDDDDSGDNQGKPVLSVETQRAANPKTYGITASGKITISSTAYFSNAGILIDEKAQPTVEKSTYNGKPSSLQTMPNVQITQNGKSTTANVYMFTVSFSGLKPNTTYHYRAYYNNNNSIVYGQDMTFTTKSANINAVDLGLKSKTLWATCNIGAEEPQDVGSYFPLGEYIPNAYYRSNSYANDLLDVNDNKDPIGDLDETLKQMDPAFKYYGGNWRTPTIEQFNELIADCKWTWTDNYLNTNKKGYIVESKTNPNNKIFLPVVGGYYDNKTQKEINKGYYNSRLINTSVPAKRNILYLSDQSRYLLSLESDKACLTRPVMKSN